MTPHVVFGFMWTIAAALLTLSFMSAPEDPDSRAATVWLWWVGLLGLAVGAGVAGRLVTPGAFWHS